MKTIIVGVITVALGLFWLLARRRAPSLPFPWSHSSGFPFSPTIRRLLNRLQSSLIAVRHDLADHAKEVKQLVPPLEGTAVSAETVMAALVTLAETHQRLQDRLAAAERQLAQQSRELQAQWQEVRSDPLTGLPNRRVFEQSLRQRISLFRKEGQTFALAIFDVDHFKNINDTFGHKVGDEVLTQVAQALQAAAPSGSVLARIGGEEFALIWPHLRLLQTLEEAETVRQSAAALSFTDAPELRPSLSCGVAIFGQKDDENQIFERADAALYAAKQAGRDITFFHDGTQPVVWKPVRDLPPAVDSPSCDDLGSPSWESDPEVQSLTLTLRAKLSERLGLSPRHESHRADHCALGFRSQ